MYHDFYQMKQEAFATHPSLNVFFQSRVHKEAWNYLLDGIASKQPYLLVTGDYGTGKTMLCGRLGVRLNLLRKQGKIFYTYFSTGNCTYRQIVHEIAASLGAALQQGDESSIQDSIYTYLKNSQSPRPLYLIFDESHELNGSLLKKLLMLSNFNHNGFFPIRLIFFAHLSFLDVLKTPQLKPLEQRIKRRYQLTPFNFQETREYIYFRLFQSRSPGIPAFTIDALQAIFSFSRGVPRMINNVCEACLIAGASQKRTVIDSTLVLAAIASSQESLRGEDDDIRRSSQQSKPPEKTTISLAMGNEEESSLPYQNAHNAKQSKRIGVKVYILGISIFLISMFCSFCLSSWYY